LTTRAVDRALPRPGVIHNDLHGTTETMAKRKKKAKAKKRTTRTTTARSKARKPAKAASRKSASKAAKPQKIAPASKPRTKSEVYRVIAEQTGLARKDVQSVFDNLGTILAADLGRRGPGVMQVPGLMKVTVKRMPAKKARKGINPFTGEETIFKAKPARNVVKVRPLSALKKMV